MRHCWRPPPADGGITKRREQRRLSVMEGENAVLAFENDAFVPRCEGSNQRAEAVEFRFYDATGSAAATTPPLEAVATNAPSKSRSSA